MIDHIGTLIPPTLLQIYKSSDYISIYIIRLYIIIIQKIGDKHFNVYSILYTGANLSFKLCYYILSSYHTLQFQTVNDKNYLCINLNFVVTTENSNTIITACNTYNCFVNTMYK